MISLAYIKKDAYWNCRCDCGTAKIIKAPHLKDGTTFSCGCWSKEKVIERSTKHGHSRGSGPSRTYKSWQTMKTRCYDSTHERFQYYGGRGVTVCGPWLHSFEYFLADVGERPPGKTLDRFPDTNGNYEPGNVRWATPKEQAQNRNPPRPHY